MFAVSSTITPVMLGVCVGAMASGSIRVEDGVVTTGFFTPWLQPFPFAVGAFALSLFAPLAATYLTLEVEEPSLQEDFRIRALGAAVATGVAAFVALGLAVRGAPVVLDGLLHRWWSLPFQLVTGVAAIGALWTRRYRLARVLVATQAVLILNGWGLAQYPMVVVPDLPPSVGRGW